MEAKTYTLSYAYLNDLSYKEGGPWHFTFEAVDDHALKQGVKKIINRIFEEAANKEPKTSMSNPLQFPSHWNLLVHHYKDEVIADLLDNHFWVYNRYEKYYVVAFALNYTRFEVFSKDYNKRLIKWRDCDQYDPVSEKGILSDDEYNENPVITLFKQWG